MGVCILGYLLWFALHPSMILRSWSYPWREPITHIEWYQPLEQVRGGRGSDLPVASPGQIEIQQKSLWLAAALALRHNARAFLVVHRGKIVIERYWGGFHKDARSNSMSMAKTLAALLVGVAIQEGRISSEEQKASHYFPEWRGDGRDDIRIRHLLQMQSGLRGDGSRWSSRSDVARLYFGKDLASYLWQIPLQKPPGRFFEYKDADTQLLGALLERATKQRYARYLSDKLWRHVAASDGYVWLDHPDGMAKTACCFFATTRDWARLGLLLLHKGRIGNRQIIPESWIQKMLVPSLNEPQYGYQIWLASHHDISDTEGRLKWLADDVFFLAGILHQRVYVVPSAQLVIVRIGERSRAWSETTLPNAVLRGISAWKRMHKRTPTTRPILRPKRR